MLPLSSSRRPNTRVQRTRSSPSALRSPLTRHPLGDERERMRAPIATFRTGAFGFGGREGVVVSSRRSVASGGSWLMTKSHSSARGQI
jgi:hypothetical protein